MRINRNHRTPEPTPFLYQSGQQLQPSQRLVLQYGRISLHRFPARIFVTRTEGQINARLSKSFLKETLTITFTANDILRTGYFHFDLYGIDAYMENRIYRDFQRFGLQVSYKFNATKSKYKGTGAGQSEKNRL